MELPKIIKDGLQIDVIRPDGQGGHETESLDLETIFDMLTTHDSHRELPVLVLKLLQGINRLVYIYSGEADKKKEELDALDSKLRMKYSKKDESNPLFLNGQKIVNATIDAAIEKDEDHQRYTKELKELKNYKSFLLTTYSILKMVLEVVNTQMGNGRQIAMGEEEKEEFKELAKGL